MATAGFMTHMRAKLAGEIPARELEAFRSAGAAAYESLLAVEDRRAALAAAGTPIGDVERSTRILFLAHWCAFANQQLGEAFLEADYEYDPATVGYVPPVTAEQATAFFGEVEGWLRRARRAEADAQYQLDVRLPSTLPGWVDVEPCPMAHLHAMISAARRLIEHAEIAVDDLRKLGGDRLEHFGKIDAELQAAKHSAQYADGLHGELHGGRAGRDLHDRVEQSSKLAVEGAYLVGQLAAMPELAAGDLGAGTAAAGAGALPGPGTPGFDPWCLTDPKMRSVWERDRAAVSAVDTLWRYDPAPRETLTVQAQIDAAARRGDIELSGAGHYYCCPWAPIYRVVNPVKIGGKRLLRGQTFTFDVSAEEVAEGGEFKREILVAQFSPTNEVDYCNPDAGGHG